MMILDGIKSFFGSLNESTSKNASTHYTVSLPLQQQIVNQYNSSGMARKVVEAPASDMFRTGISWRGENEIIERIEEAYRDFAIIEKLIECRINKDVFGAAALVIIDSNDPQTPLSYGQNGLHAINVAPMRMLRRDSVIDDITSENYGQFEHYVLKSDKGKADQKIHRSRVILMRGNRHKGNADITSMGYHWDVPRLANIYDDIKNYEAASANTSEMFHKALIDSVRIKDMDKAIQAGKEKMLLERWELVRMYQSISKFMLIDSEDEVQRQSIDFAGVPQTLFSLLLNVCCSADMPATRVMGMSPAGLSATGESDTRNYYDALSATREREVTTVIEQINEVLFKHLFDNTEVEVTWEFNPLWEPNDQEKATTEKTKAETFKAYQSTGLVPDSVTFEYIKQVLIEGEHGPALESAYSEADPLSALSALSGPLASESGGEGEEEPGDESGDGAAGETA